MLIPLAIDAVLAEHDLNQWEQEFFVSRNHLIVYVRFHISCK